MERFVDYYRILQIRFDADQETINKVYKALTKKYQPDVAEDKVYANINMKDINTSVTYSNRK